MKLRVSRTAACAAAAAVWLGSVAAYGQDLGYEGELTEGIPEPDAEFQALEAIHEGGLHFFYVTTGDPEALPWVFGYRAALQAADWTILDLGGGENPFGSPGGAKLVAEHADGRYLRLNAGHPGVQHLDHAPSVATFIDACVWPHPPEDDTCRSSRFIDVGDGVEAGQADVGVMGDLAVGVPRPGDAEYQSEESLPEGGRHFYYISAVGHFDAFNRYMFALHEAGWTIGGVVTNGDESAGSGTVIATDGSRHLEFSAGGSGTITHIDACVWPQQPSEARCPRNAND